METEPSTCANLGTAARVVAEPLLCLFIILVWSVYVVFAGDYHAVKDAVEKFRTDPMLCVFLGLGGCAVFMVCWANLRRNRPTVVQPPPQKVEV
jgi:hypothetical protein